MPTWQIVLLVLIYYVDIVNCAQLMIWMGDHWMFRMIDHD